MATKDFIYDLLDGLKQNKQDYILIIPNNTAPKSEEEKSSIELFYKIQEKGNDAITSLLFAIEELQNEVESLAEEFDIDLSELLDDDEDDDD